MPIDYTSYKGIHSKLPEPTELHFRVTIVGFQPDPTLNKLIQDAASEGETLLIGYMVGDPDEDLSAALEKHNHKIGPYKLNPYDNDVLTTYSANLAPGLSNAPMLKKVIQYVKDHYLDCAQL